MSMTQLGFRQAKLPPTKRDFDPLTGNMQERDCAAERSILVEKMISFAS